MLRHNRPMAIAALILLFSFSAAADILDEFEKMTAPWQAFKFTSRAEAFGTPPDEIGNRVTGKDARDLLEAIRKIEDPEKLTTLITKFSQFRNAMLALKENGAAGYAQSAWGEEDPRTQFAKNPLFKDAARDILGGETVEGLLTLLDKDAEAWQAGDAKTLLDILDGEKVYDVGATAKSEIANELARLYEKLRASDKTWGDAFQKAHALYHAAFHGEDVKGNATAKIARDWLRNIGKYGEKNRDIVLTEVESRFNKPLDAVKFLIPDVQTVTTKELEELVLHIRERAKMKRWTPRTLAKALEAVESTAKSASHPTLSRGDRTRFDEIANEIHALRQQTDPPLRMRIEALTKSGDSLTTAISKALPEVEKITYDDLKDLTARLPDGFSERLPFKEAMALGRAINEVTRRTNEKSGMSFNEVHDRLNHLFTEVAQRSGQTQGERERILANYLEMADFESVGGKRDGTENDIRNLLRALDPNPVNIKNVLNWHAMGDESMAKNNPIKYRAVTLDLINHILEKGDMQGAKRVIDDMIRIEQQQRRSYDDPIWNETATELHRLAAIADMNGDRWYRLAYGGDLRGAFQSLARAYQLGRFHDDKIPRLVTRPGGENGPRTIQVNVADAEAIVDFMAHYKGELRRLPVWQLEDMIKSLKKIPFGSARISNAIGELHEHILHNKDTRNSSENYRQALTDTILAREPTGRHSEPPGELLPKLLRKHVPGFRNNRPREAHEFVRNWLSKEGAQVAKNPAWTKTLIGSLDDLFPGDTPEAIENRKEIIDTFQRAAEAESATDVEFRKAYERNEDRLLSGANQLRQASRAIETELQNSKKMSAKIGRTVRSWFGNGGAAAGCLAGMISIASGG